MKIEVTKDEPDFSRTDNLGNPTINSRQATTQLYVKDGETVVIGGIMKTKESDNEKAVSGLSKIPLLGLLFKNNAVASESEDTADLHHPAYHETLEQFNQKGRGENSPRPFFIHCMNMIPVRMHSTRAEKNPIETADCGENK